MKVPYLARIGLLFAFFSFTAQATLILNEDFESGVFGSWNTFTTPNGTLGHGGLITSFDTTGSGTSLAAEFRVGQVIFGGAAAGGGIYRSMLLVADTYNLSVNVAAFAHSLSNSSGGIFELLFDNVVVDSFNTASISAGAVERSTLFYTNFITAGFHEIRIRITRPFLQTADTPYQYIDNIRLESRNAIPMPEPGVIILIALAIIIFSLQNRKRIMSKACDIT